LLRPGQAHRLMHCDDVLAAIREESAKRMRSGGIEIVSVLINIAKDEKADPKDRLKAVGMVLDRIALQAITEHKITVQGGRTLGRPHRASRAAYQSQGA
jgi:hypothetical protein